MIRSLQDYRSYLEADRIALGKGRRSLRSRLRELAVPDYIWRFQRLLRKVEYLKNRESRGVIDSLVYIYCKLSYRRLSVRLGFTIPENVFGPGLAIVHYGTIVINENARIGANCRIHPDTNVGASAGSERAPRLGDNVYLAPGVKIFGDISIASNTAIGANAVVTRSFVQENTMIAGVPAEVIKTIDIRTIIRCAQPAPAAVQSEALPSEAR
jgi:serine O-acetyltransferase